VNPPDPILDHLLDAVRQTKRRRRSRRIAWATAACILPAIAFLMLPRQEEKLAPAALREPSAAPAPAEPAHAMLAMVVWQNGSPCLEELPAEDLGLVQLHFGLDPVIAYPDAYWRDPWN
jgi:hypothetical protein